MPLYESQKTLVNQLNDAIKRIKVLELRGGSGSRGTGSGGPETPSLDTTPPVVTTQPAVVNGRNVRITVVANEPVSGVLRFGTSPENLTLSRSTTGGLVQTLTFSIEDLAPNTTYYASVTTRDVAGNSTVTALSSFTTTNDAAAVDGLRILSGPNVAAQSRSAAVTFTTSASATARLDYRPQGSNAAYVSAFELQAASTSHLVTLNNLTPGTSYQLNVYVASDASGFGSATPTSFVFSTQTVDSNGVSVSRVSAVPVSTGGVNVSSTLQSEQTLQLRRLVISIRDASSNASSDATYGSYDTGLRTDETLVANSSLQLSGFKLLGPGSYVAFVSYQLTSDPGGTWYTSTSTPFTLTNTPTTTTPEPTPVAKTPPSVSFSSTVTNLTANFRATASDADGSVVGYDWDFGDAAGSRTSAPTHTYAQGGTYTVSVTAIDNDGYASQSTQQEWTSPGRVR